ncbi:MAG: 4-hydroxy-tetrahydrodipicolinate reductase [Candidatus Brocadiae bacterium]|nr:4-hydroxy-tetrahydrodipicolinate reductase [Candidatus Brocadiia bacterium]
MKIALIGYGQMGHILEMVAQKRQHTIVAKIDPYVPDATHKEISEISVKEAQVCIDFSHPEAFWENLKKLLSLEKNIVAGTTGWYDRAEEAKNLIGNKIGFVYGSNFSLGVNLFYRIVEKAADTMKAFAGYDVAGVEYHHNKKADSPSGTAKSLAQIIKTQIPRKESIVYDAVNRKILPQELHFASLRCGSIPGTHKIFFDSDADTIELSHTARNREGFALGAILAAEWIIEKKGFFTVQDFFKEIL